MAGTNVKADVKAGATASSSANARTRLMIFFMSSLLWWTRTRVQGYHSRPPSDARGTAAGLALRGARLDARSPLE
jgi:hypothetical protein